MPIEIRGVAYLMNPPNFEKLGLTAASGATGQPAPGACAGQSGRRKGSAARKNARFQARRDSGSPDACQHGFGERDAPIAKSDRSTRNAVRRAATTGAAVLRRPQLCRPRLPGLTTNLLTRPTSASRLASEHPPAVPGESCRQLGGWRDSTSPQRHPLLRPRNSQRAQITIHWQDNGFPANNLAKEKRRTMKKPKLNFDSAKIKGFFIEHGEKFLVAIAVAILVSFGISAINRETLPENLRAPSIKTRAGNAQVAVNSSKPPAKIVPEFGLRGECHLLVRGNSTESLQALQSAEHPGISRPGELHRSGAVSGHGSAGGDLRRRLCR